jgi:dihydrofolate reductase
MEEALKIGKDLEHDELYVIGGAQIYQQAMPYADKLYLTLVDSEVKDADAFFPEYKEFKKVVSSRKSSDQNYTYEFIELER